MSTPVRAAARRRIADWQALFMLPRSIWMPILAMSIVAIAAFLFNEWSVKRVHSAAEQLAWLTSTQGDVAEIRAMLADAEAQQRGFLLSREHQYLESYEKSLDQLLTVSAQLRLQSASDASLLAEVRKLDALRVRRVEELRGTAEQAQRPGAAAAQILASTAEGRETMQAFRTQVQRMLTDLETQSTQIRASAAYNVQRSRIASGALGLLTLALLLLAVRLLIKDFWRQDATRQEQANERLRLEQLVGERTAELSALTTYLQSVTEVEKAELARNLHDELGGVLTAAKMDLAWLQGRASANEPEVHGKLKALASGLEEAMEVKQRVVENLRPALLDHFGLATALQSHFEETCKKAALSCQVRVPDTSEPIPQDLAIALFRVGQEALTNIIRHAQATRVEMSFAIDHANYRIRIADDGIGMDPARVSGALSHGLVGMRHRIATLHGQFLIGANQPRGTRIDVIVPRTRI
jgi:signal transduction histidine kinase